MKRPDIDTIEHALNTCTYAVSPSTGKANMQTFIRYIRHLEAQREQVNVNTKNLHERIAELEAELRPRRDTCRALRDES